MLKQILFQNASLLNLYLKKILKTIFENVKIPKQIEISSKN